MDSYSNNVSVLKKLLGIRTYQRTREFERWYYNTVVNYLWYESSQPPRFLSYNSRKKYVNPNTIDVCFLKLELKGLLKGLPKGLPPKGCIDQFGGFGEGMKKKYFYQYTTGKKTYTSKITGIYATNENDEVLAKFFLLSPLHQKINLNCAFVKIDRNHAHVVDMIGLSNHYSCTDYGDPPKAGRIYLTMVLQFLTQHARQLGIQKFELGDNSKYQCPTNRLTSVSLEVGRQLVGRYPYYIQFGFRPKYKKNLVILKHNRQIMSHLITDQKIVKLCHQDDAPTEIVDYVREHLGQQLTKTMKYISDTNCPFYSQICLRWFRKFGLILLENPEYVLNVADFFPIVKVNEISMTQ